MSVAQTILSQLGGNRFVMMTGSKRFLNGGDYLQFDLGKGTKIKANKCRVELTADDLYNMTFYKWNAKALEMVEVARSEGLYSDMLQTEFTNQTGFFTKL